MHVTCNTLRCPRREKERERVNHLIKNSKNLIKIGK